MSELLFKVEQQGKQIERLLKMVGDLTILVMKSKVDDTWVGEDIAAEMIGYKDGRTLRKRVKSGLIQIDYRNTRGRNWQYSRKSLMKFKERTSVS